MKKILLISALISSVVFASVPSLAMATDFNCAILPKELCDSATSEGTDKATGDVSKTGVFKLLTLVLNVLTGLVGVVAVGVFVYAGILYSSAGSDSNKVTQAKNLIAETTVGLLVYAVLFFVLNWLIPGGIIG